MTLDQHTARVLFTGRKLAEIAAMVDLQDMAEPLEFAVDAWMQASVEVNALYELAALPDPRMPVCLWVVNGKERLL